MNTSVYKSEGGRDLVEKRYREILASYGGRPFEQRFPETSAGRTHVLDFGRKGKPPVLMLHGSMSNSATWLGCAGMFAERFHILCADIPGEPGLSEPARMPLASDAPLKWLDSLLDVLGLSRVARVGMSLGGWYALRFATRRQERVTAASLITAGGVAPERRDFIKKAMFCMIFGKPGKKRLNRLIYHEVPVPPEVGEFQAIVNANFNPVVEPLPIFTDEELRGLTMPLQFFGGDHDALMDTPATAARLSALVPHAEVNILPDMGHVILDRFEAVRDFLSASV